MEFYLKLIFIQLYASSKDTLCYIHSLFHVLQFILSFFTELRPTYYITPGPQKKKKKKKPQVPTS